MSTGAGSDRVEGVTAERPSLLRAWLDALRSGWWIYVFAPVVLTVLTGGLEDLDQVAVAYVICLLATLSFGAATQGAFVVAEHREWTLPHNLHVPLLIVIGVAIGTEVTLLLIALAFDVSTAHMRLGMWAIGGTMATVISIGSVIYDRLRDHARAVELREEQAQRQALQAKLDALQSRMNPHFLFNSLNSLAALVEEDPAAAVNAVERLAELLRYTLERSGDRLVPIADELQCVREYLALERLRFGDRLQVAVDLDPELATVEVPPLSIQPLVENAIEHGVAHSRAPVTVQVEVRRGGPGVQSGVRVEVRDDSRGERGGGSSGTGTAQQTLAARLRLLYGEGARFEAGPRPEGGYRASFVIPEAGE